MRIRCASTVVRPMILSVAIASGVVACDSSSTPAPDAKAKPSPLEPRGIQEMKRVKQDVEDAQKAGMKRTDDAIDRAAQGDAVDRGAPGR